MRRGRAIQVGRHRILGRRGRLRRGKGILRRRGTGGDRGGALCGTVGPRAGAVRLTRTTTHASLQLVGQCVREITIQQGDADNRGNRNATREGRQEEEIRWLRREEILDAMDGLGGREAPDNAANRAMRDGRRQATGEVNGIGIIRGKKRSDRKLTE